MTPDPAEARREAVPPLDLREYAARLLKQLEAVHADPRFEAVWTMYALHGGHYTGPFYTRELDDLRSALSGVSRPPEESK